MRRATLPCVPRLSNYCKYIYRVSQLTACSAFAHILLGCTFEFLCFDDAITAAGCVFEAGAAGALVSWIADSLMRISLHRQQPRSRGLCGRQRAGNVRVEEGASTSVSKYCMDA